MPQFTPSNSTNTTESLAAPLADYTSPSPGTSSGGVGLQQASHTQQQQQQQQLQSQTQQTRPQPLQQSAQQQTAQAPLTQQQVQQQQQRREYPAPAPIAPAPDGFSRFAVKHSSSSSASGTNSTPSGSSREMPARPKRKLINLACTACQKRKSKCDGQQPCNLCVTKNTECNFVHNDKQSRIDRLEQEKNQISAKVNQYKSVVEYLRTGADEEATEILRRIRSGEPTEDTIALIESSMLLLGRSPASSQPSSKSRRISEVGQGASSGCETPQTMFSSGGEGSYALAQSRPGPRRTPSQLSPPSDAISPSDQGSEAGSAGTKRKFDVLEQENNELREFIEALYSVPETEALSLLRRSRSGGVRDDGGYGLDAIPSRRELGVEGPGVLHLPSEPKYNIKGSKWTRITEDDAFLSHLIRAYFRNEHLAMPCFDEEIFLEDARNGRNEYCSSMLFNAVLSAGAQFCQHCAHRASPWKQECWSRVFFDASFYLRRADEGTEDLMNLQTIMVLALTASRNGRDRLGSEMLAQAVSMARSIGLCRDPATWTGKPSDPKEADKWLKARQVTVWSLFHIQGVMQFGFRRATLMKQGPTVPIPYGNSKTTSEMELRTQFELAVITNEIAMLHFSDNEEDLMPTCSIEQTEGSYQRLLVWQDQAQEQGLDPNASLASWMRLLLHMHWHFLTICLFKPFLDEPNLPTHRRFYAPRARAVTNASVSGLRGLMRAFAARRGFVGCASYMMYILAMIANTALDDLEISQSRPILSSPEEASEAESKGALEDCVLAVEKMGQDFYMAQGLLKILQMRVQRLGMTVKPAAQTALNLVSDRAWVETAYREMRCQYPVGISGVDGVRVDEVIRRDYEMAYAARSAQGV